MRETPRDTASRRVARAAKGTRQNGTAIAVIREKDGLSQAKLARLAGIGQSTLSGIESELDDASMPTLNLIARKLGIPVDAIMRRRHAETEAEDDQEGDAALQALAS